MIVCINKKKSVICQYSITEAKLSLVKMHSGVSITVFSQSLTDGLYAWFQISLKQILLGPVVQTNDLIS